MKQLYAPNGVRIAGTKEMIPGTALVTGWSDMRDPIYGGGTEVDWDGQTTQRTRSNDAIVVVDEDGNEHSAGDCTLEEPNGPTDQTA
jgi:hypothetical protein